ncbi:MAG: MBL fold metallo-hydrolase [Pseudomonadales bacterium]
MRIHLIRTRFSNTYLIEDNGGMFVVDIAARCDGFVLNYVEEKLNKNVFDIKLVTCTHDDVDHIGGLANLARSCQAIAAIPHAAHRSRVKLYKNPYGPAFRLMTAMAEAFRGRSRAMYLDRERIARYPHVPNVYLTGKGETQLPEIRRLKDRHRLEGFTDWEIIHTPGHSWDSICFFHHPTRSLITGDTILGSASKGQLVHPAIYDDPRRLKQSVKRLIALKPQTVYPGHGSIFSGENLLDHL